MPAIGSMNYECVLLRRTKIGANELNEDLFEYVPVFTFWASKPRIQGGESFSDESRYAHRTVTLRTHWLSDVLLTDRVRVEGVDFDVKAVNEIPFRRGTELECRAVEIN